jgi:Uma2 family endonuclease
MSTAVERYRFTVDEYYKLAEAGVLSEDSRVELIEGEIVMMTPIGRRHAACVDRLNRLLVHAVGESAIVRVQNPVRLGDRSEPEPDLALLRPRDDFYAEREPGPADALLIVEVADSSLAYDRGVKLPLYARAGVAETWIVDLGERVIEVHRSPGPQGYAERRIFRVGEVVQLSTPEIAVAVDSVLP